VLRLQDLGLCDLNPDRCVAFDQIDSCLEPDERSGIAFPSTSLSRTEITKYVTFSVYFEHVHAHIPYLIFTSAFSLHFLSDGTTHVRGGRPPTGRGGVEAEAEEEVFQGLLLCSMCRNDHCLGYVITSG
jgi:hypothetical protein